MVRLISWIARCVSIASEKSAVTWCAAPSAQGHCVLSSALKGVREQVMTRQPAAANSLTVACPIPLDAPAADTAAAA